MDCAAFSRLPNAKFLTCLKAGVSFGKRMKTSSVQIKRNTVAAWLLSTFGLATLGMMSSVIAAPIQAPTSQDKAKSITTTQAVACTPREGVILTLRKKSDGSIVDSTTSDSQGKFRFKVVSPGSYYVTLSIGKAAGQKGQGKSFNEDITTCVVMIEGGKDGLIHAFQWDFKSNKSFAAATQAASRAVADSSKNYSHLESNGFDPTHGAVFSAIVKSKSNIRNN